MSQYALCKAIHEVYISREATEAFRAGDFRLLDQFVLTTEERTALEAKDLVTLWSLGVHPILLFHLSAVLNPRETYIREVVPRIQGVPNDFYDYYRRGLSVDAPPGAGSPSTTDATPSGPTPHG